MRPTAVTHSSAPSGKTYMGWWGNMGGPKQRGIIYYGVSSFQQSAMRGAFSGYFFNGYKRMAGHAPYVIIPLAVGYWTYTWGTENYHWRQSKAGHLAGAEH